MQRRIGIYPGTFDPVHAGHIAFAEQAREVNVLDEIVLLPERSPRYKPDTTDITHRIALARAATRAHSYLRVESLRSEQFSVTQTLPELRALFGDAQLTLLLGSDVARTLGSWDGISQLLEEVSLVIGMRTGDDADELADLITTLDARVNVSFIRTAHEHVASSTIRNDRTLHASLHQDVCAYIEQHGLYV